MTPEDHRPELEGLDQDPSRRWALIVERTTNMVVVTDRERRIKWVNPAYTHITGWTLAEVLGRTPRSFLHGPRTNQAEAARIGELLRRGQAVHDAELLNYKKSGELYWVSMRIDPILDASGTVVEYVSIQTDITERRRRELESARMLRLLSEAQRLAHLGNMEHDIASGHVDCSDEIFRILDASKGEVDTTYESLMACTHPDDVEMVRREYERAISGGWPFESEHRVVSKAGQVKWIHMRGVLDDIEDGGATVCRLAVQDITERKRAEQLAREKALSDRVARAQRETLSRVGHEIRTPLHAILGFADLLERQNGLAQAQDAVRQLGLIRSAARHLLAIANDMMDLTAMHEGKIVLAIRSVPVASAVAEVVGMLQGIAGEKGLTLSVLEPVQALHVRADRQRLIQVLVNLVGNAIKYNRPQGSIRITWSAEGERVLLRVEDTGIGIEEPHLKRLFEPFYRAGAADTAPPEQGSNGLGLAITKSLMDAMDGSVTVASTPGRGSVFTLLLKQAQGGEEEPVSADDGTPGRPAQAPRRPRSRILYIEDNEVNRLLVEGFVSQRPDLGLVCCNDGASGLDLARRLLPDLVLVDMNLPDMSGYDVLRAVLAEPQLRRTCCVAFSGDVDPQDIEGAIRAGFLDYLCKPIEAEEFLRAIDRLLAAGRLSPREWIPR